MFDSALFSAGSPTRMGSSPFLAGAVEVLAELLKMHTSPRVCPHQDAVMTRIWRCRVVLSGVGSFAVCLVGLGEFFFLV